MDRTAWGLAGVFFATFAYFYNGAGWNANSRLNAIFACVEPGPDRGTFRIDRFLPDPAGNRNTGDWSGFAGHYYSNKAPGPILLGVAVYAPVYAVETALGWDPTSPRLSLANAYIIHLGASVAPIALALGYFYQLAKRLLSASADWARTVTLWLGFSTALFPYATQLWGHVTAAAFVILAVERTLSQRQMSKVWAGFWIGCAVLSEYSCAITLVAIAVYLGGLGPFWQRVKNLAGFALGGLLPAIVFGLYHRACFGGWLTLAPKFNNPAFAQVHGRPAFSWPKLEPLLDLTITPYRGLFVYMPILLVALFALVFRYRQFPAGVASLITINSVGFLAMNAGFDGWYGGNCMGPRYLVPALPLLFLSLVFVPGLFGRLAHGLAIGGAVIQLIFVTLGPTPEPALANPIREYGARFFAGDWRRQAPPIRLLDANDPNLQRLGVFNLGELLGLTGPASLVPLAVFLACFCYLTRSRPT